MLEIRRSSTNIIRMKMQRATTSTRLRASTRARHGRAAHDRRAAIVALALAGTLWGLTVPLSKLGLDWLGAGWLAVARFALAAPLLALVARRGLRAALTPRIAAAGALGYGVVIVVQNAGIERTSVSHAALIVGAVPVLVAAIAAVLGRGSGSRLMWAGSLLALAGVGLVAGGGGAGTSVGGDLLVLLSVTMSAGLIVAQPALLAGRDPAAVTAVQLGAGGLAALPLALILEGAPPAPTSAGVVVAVLALALIGTMLAFSLFAWAQARVPAELAGAFVNLEPLVGALTGAVAFHDVDGPAQFAGGVAILAANALGALPRPRRDDREPHRLRSAEWSGRTRSWASSTSRPTRSRTAERSRTRLPPSRTRAGSSPRAPRSSTSAASRPVPAPPRCRSPRSWSACCRSWRASPA
jgi:drug/metabolite transporter (DMT)-like permease